MEKWFDGQQNQFPLAKDLTFFSTNASRLDNDRTCLRRDTNGGNGGHIRSSGVTGSSTLNKTAKRFISTIRHVELDSGWTEICKREMSYFVLM